MEHKKEKKEKKEKSQIMERYEIPYEEEDPRFVASFALEDREEAQRFFHHYGFVVFRDILSAKECEESVSVMFSLLGFLPENPETWATWPSSGMEKYGMPTREPVFERPFLMNRQNPRLLRAFSTILGKENLLVNHDRCCLFRPTRRVPFKGGERDMPHWRTGHNLHLDLNPWKYVDQENSCRERLEQLPYRPKNFIFENNQVTFSPKEIPLQGVINFRDNYREDGGFIVVPGFRHHFKAWIEANKDPAAGERGYKEEEDGYRFPPEDPLQKMAVRVSMRQGSVVIWDQRTPHGSTFNDSQNFRAAQFVKMFPDEISPQRAARRADALRAIVRKKGFEPFLSQTGRAVFGFGRG